jgi:hypothetical protein
MIAETTAIVSSGNGGTGLNSPEHPAWLTWEDSNFHITTSKNAFEMSTEFPLFQAENRPGDFCNCEMWTLNTAPRHLIRDDER